MRRLSVCLALGLSALVLHGCGLSKVEMSSATQQNLSNQTNVAAGGAWAGDKAPSAAFRVRLVDYAAKTELSNQWRSAGVWLWTERPAKRCES